MGISAPIFYDTKAPLASDLLTETNLDIFLILSNNLKLVIF
jgi:hypothetical protein